MSGAGAAAPVMAAAVRKIPAGRSSGAIAASLHRRSRTAGRSESKFAIFPPLGDRLVPYASPRDAIVQPSRNDPVALFLPDIGDAVNVRSEHFTAAMFERRFENAHEAPGMAKPTGALAAGIATDHR